jgi:hypothetical protein
VNNVVPSLPKPISGTVSVGFRKPWAMVAVQSFPVTFIRIRTLSLVRSGNEANLRVTGAASVHIHRPSSCISPGFPGRHMRTVYPILFSWKSKIFRTNLNFIFATRNWELVKDLFTAGIRTFRRQVYVADLFLFKPSAIVLTFTSEVLQFSESTRFVW